MFPFEFVDGSLLIAIANPLEVESLDGLSHLIKTPIEPVLADGRQIEEAINTRYDRNSLAESEIDEEKSDDVAVQVQDETLDVEQDGPDESDASSHNTIGAGYHSRAIRKRASDIHLEPLDTRFRVRFRIDGELQEMANPPPKRLQLPVISRIKVKGRLEYRGKNDFVMVGSSSR